MRGSSSGSSDPPDSYVTKARGILRGAQNQSRIAGYGGELTQTDVQSCWDQYYLEDSIEKSDASQLDWQNACDKVAAELGY